MVKNTSGSCATARYHATADTTHVAMVSKCLIKSSRRSGKNSSVTTARKKRPAKNKLTKIRDNKNRKEKKPKSEVRPISTRNYLF